MRCILEKLRIQNKRSSTAKNYLGIWRNFNNFIIKLDKKPYNWEDRICLFAAYLVDRGVQSSTLKSYYSAIKAVLKDDGYTVNDDKVLLTSLARTCKLVNDKVQTRLPISKPLLEMLLFEIQRKFECRQPYLEVLYKTIFLLAYYGLFRIGELTTGTHPIKARDVHIAQNKSKMLFILYSSKTHGRESLPQKVKIAATSNNTNNPNKFFCPFRTSREYLALRGNYTSNEEPFFIFRDRSPVTPPHVREILKLTLKAVNLSPRYYSCHSFRVGRCSDLVKFGLTLPQVRLAGRWSSNAVYRYIRN